MKKILYLECNSGISGDMTVGALLDLGADREVLENALESLGVEGYHLHFGRTVKCGLDAYDFDVHLEEEADDQDGHHHEDHDHHHEDHAHHHEDHNHHHEDHNHHHEDHNHHHEDHNPHYEDHSPHYKDHNHHHEDHASHHEDHGHTHENHTHHHIHAHRNLHDIYKIIDRLNSSDKVKAKAKHMFDIVAEAEAKAHGLPIEQVHFHEVGAIDSIVDIISVAVCLDNLGIEEVVVSPLAEGRGHVRCQHGVIPVPVPATANIAAAYGLELQLTDNRGEMVTPTGAAIAAALKTSDKLPPSCRIKKIGMGAGKKDFKQANVLRAMILETEAESRDQMWILESNIDDCSGEMLGFAMELLLEAGASDVWYTPVYMKKNRPAYMLSVLCREEKVKELEELVFIQTTTIGIRKYPVERTVMNRRIEQVETDHGTAKVKVCEYEGRVFYYPEYESVTAICRKTDIDFQSVYDEIRKKATEQL